LVPARWSALIVVAAFLWTVACGGAPTDGQAPGGAASSSAAAAKPKADDPPPAPRVTNPERDDRPRVIFLGDSLTAGLGLDATDSFPSLIEHRLRQAGYDFEVVNAGVSGDTSAGGLRRLDWALADGKPKILIVALGGNDGLRGLPPGQLEDNLAAIIERGQKSGLAVILAGMEAPPNFGADYTSSFRAVYPRLAKRYDVRLIPFLLEGVAGNPALNQADGIHPNRRGAELVADLVWKTLEPVVARTRDSSR
jgi:acyl-CoA thioesterase-1